MARQDKKVLSGCFFAFSKRKFLRMLLKAFADTKKKYKGSAFCV